MSILHSIKAKQTPWQEKDFPFNLPAIQKFEMVDLRADVIFFVGENGSGKSTFLESVASLIDAETIAHERMDNDPSYGPSIRLARELRPVWVKKTNKAVFLRGEDYLGYARRLHAELDQANKNMADDPLWSFDMKAVNSQVRSISHNQSGNLHAQSHGEGFLAFFQGRLRPKTIYLLDEPESALSPYNQMAMLAMLHELAQQGSQFIIATHSPILLAYPNSKIYSFSEKPFSEITFEQSEHVSLTKTFLNNPEKYLREMGLLPPVDGSASTLSSVISPPQS